MPKKVAHFTDQTGFQFELPHPPRRIVSLVPSQTELLHALGLSEEVVGITKFCVHPDEWFRNKTRVGGTKMLHLDKIRELAPDLIIANKEENNRADIETLRHLAPVWTSDIADLDSALQMIRSIGALTGKAVKADHLAREIALKFAQLKPLSKPLRTLYLIWKKPYMCAGSDSFIQAMLRTCGFHPEPAGLPRYPLLTMEEIVSLKPDLVFFSSEPYPFKEKDLEDFRLKMPDSLLELVDGEYFSWYGSRLLKAPEYFGEIIERLERHRLVT